MLHTFKCKYCALNEQIKMTICTIVARIPESPRIHLLQYFIQLRDARFYKSHDTYRHFMIFSQVGLPILIGTHNKQLFNKNIVFHNTYPKYPVFETCIKWLVKIKQIVHRTCNHTFILTLDLNIYCIN